MTSAHEPGEIVLCIDDEPGDLGLLQIALAQCGVEADLRCVFGSREALDFLRNDWPDPSEAPRPTLILLDLRMPGVGGLECLRQLKADPALREIPVIVVTTSELESDIADARRLGAVDYVVKVAEIDRFAAALGRAVGKWMPGARIAARRARKGGGK